MDASGNISIPNGFEWQKRSDTLDTDENREDFEVLENVVIDSVFKLKCPDLNVLCPNEAQNIPNVSKNAYESNLNGLNEVEYGGFSRYVSNDEVILADIIREDGTPPESAAFIRAGPREKLYFHPKKVIAGIVTCGGLCPGLNNVIREIVKTLYDIYDIEKVYGFRGGYGGIYGMKPLELSLDLVSDIHLKGGTILSSNRGGFDSEKILVKLKELGVNQLYLIGGDGTMRGANALYKASLEENKRSGYVLSVAGVPKTIDNDIDLVDRSFGFNTAVTEALHAVRSAKTEAMCAPNGIGVVKLMGRHAGFIATHACLASGDCDLCLIPEVPIALTGPNSCLEHVARVVRKKGHAVVIVAEGAGEEILGQAQQQDAGGNRKLPAIGYFMKQKIKEHLATLQIDATVKYIDPSYMIRSVKANASDALFCLLLAQNAVHAAMAGLTGTFICLFC
uniref:Phosphofructokinase domain-containing protein n=1 Tax=Aplanochytrium stocchinoi TaxID=215587 RepID=A0A6S8AZM4_9STRA|mmetsp:Transcript_20867/g.25268  ORF Transcript_20867/g.25268 Transcript_20867/m.25268 type:complete len:450 (-) Transcript_20867:159-1508(-)